MFPDQVVCSPGIVKILEVIDETGESGPDVLFHQRFAYGFGLAGTGSSIDKEIGEPVIISDNCPVRGVKGEQGFSDLPLSVPPLKERRRSTETTPGSRDHHPSGMVACATAVSASINSRNRTCDIRDFPGNRQLAMPPPKSRAASLIINI